MIISNAHDHEFAEGLYKKAVRLVGLLREAEQIAGELMNEGEMADNNGLLDYEKTLEDALDAAGVAQDNIDAAIREYLRDAA